MRYFLLITTILSLIVKVKLFLNLQVAVMRFLTGQLQLVTLICPGTSKWFVYWKLLKVILVLAFAARLLIILFRLVQADSEIALPIWSLHKLNHFSPYNFLAIF